MNRRVKPATQAIVIVEDAGFFCCLNSELGLEVHNVATPQPKAFHHRGTEFAEMGNFLVKAFYSVCSCVFAVSSLGLEICVHE
jgi:hypothetical protein